MTRASQFTRDTGEPQSQPGPEYGLRIDDLTVTFGRGQESVTAVENFSIACAPSDFLVLLGPSGCGKSTVLNAIAGVVDPAAGSITIGDHRVVDAAIRTYLPPEKRNLGMVFQTYSLWPHMTVAKNIEFPLANGRRPLSKAQRHEKVAQVLELVRCTELAGRLPAQLSGGQQQRVALARGLVAEPDLLLLDEPLSNLDALLRQEVRDELKELHDRLSFTAVYVTHDREEALALATNLAVIRDGRIQQMGPPGEVWSSPSTPFVMRFLGGNCTPGRPTDQGVMTDFGLLAHRDVAAAPDSQVTVGIHPDRLAIAKDPAGAAEVHLVKFLGSHYEYRLLPVGHDNETSLEVRMAVSQQKQRIVPGDRVKVTADAEDVIVFPEHGDTLPPLEATAFDAIEGQPERPLSRPRG